MKPIEFRCEQNLSAPGFTQTERTLLPEEPFFKPGSMGIHDSKYSLLDKSIICSFLQMG